MDVDLKSRSSDDDEPVRKKARECFPPFAGPQQEEMGGISTKDVDDIPPVSPCFPQLFSPAADKKEASDVPGRIKYLLRKLIQTADLKTLTSRMCKEHIREQIGTEGEAVLSAHKQLIKDTIDQEVQRRDIDDSRPGTKLRPTGKGIANGRVRVRVRREVFACSASFQGRAPKCRGFVRPAVVAGDLLVLC